MPTDERLVPTDADRAWAAEAMRVDEDLSHVFNRGDRGRLRGLLVHTQLGLLLDELDRLGLDLPDFCGLRSATQETIANSRAIYDAYKRAEGNETGKW